MHLNSREKHDEAIRLVEVHGSIRAAAAASGIPRTTLRDRARLDPAILDGMEAAGTNIVPGITWAKTKNPDGTSYSLMLRPGAQEFPAFLDHVRDTVEELLAGKRLDLPRRVEDRAGSMLVLDPADVHIGKLSVASETGHRYDADIAEHRLVEGCRLLMERGAHNGATHVLLVIGNDIAHIDTPDRRTTSGTPQDTDGTIFTIHRIATRAYTRVIEIALEMGMHTQVIFNASNHDWVLGFSVAQVLYHMFREHPNVTITEYGVSEIDRKYVRYGNNLMGFTHGYGAKMPDLGGVMLREARPQMASVTHTYWYVHHLHHKSRMSFGMRPQSREKDHVDMTVMMCGIGAMEGDNTHVEIVRSPSAPDGWHHRKGYLNRQAVEAFVHHPQDGQTDRFTEWF